MTRVSRVAPGLRTGAALFAILCLGWPTTVAAIATRPAANLKSVALPGRPAAALTSVALAGRPAALGSVVLSGLASQSSAASEDRVVARAERLRAGGRSDEAADALREQLEAAPASPASLALLGEILFEAGDAAGLLPYAEAAVVAAVGAEAVSWSWWARSLVETGMVDSALAVTDRWLAASPDTPEPRLARATAQLASGDSAGAVRTLENAAEPTEEILVSLADLLLAEAAGRQAAPEDAITPPSGESIAAADRGRFAAVWAALLALDPPALDRVEGDLLALETGRSAVLEEIADHLEGDESASAAGAIVALRVGAADIARQLAPAPDVGLAPTRDQAAQGATEAVRFLREYAREAEDADLPGEVAWAAGLLARLSLRPADRVRWQSLAAEQSLAAGDTESAQRLYEETARTSEPGSGPHQRASRSLFSLAAAGSGSLDEATELLARYAEQYPDSASAGAVMWGEVALGHAREGDLATAEAVLDDARSRLPVAAGGPLDAAAARLSFYAGRRDSAEARANRSVREADVEEAELERRLALLVVVQSADTAEVRIAGAAAFGMLVSPASFDPAAALVELDRRPSVGRSVVLAFLADAAAASERPEVAAAIRQKIVVQHPGSPEAPAALLALARSAPRGEAAAWLERLIVGYPQSALAPVARRMLAELDGDTQR